MPAKSEIQQQAAGAELQRRREGKQRRKFVDMPTSEVRKIASTKTADLPHAKTPFAQRRAARRGT